MKLLSELAPGLLSFRSRSKQCETSWQKVKKLGGQLAIEERLRGHPPNHFSGCRLNGLLLDSNNYVKQKALVSFGS